MSSSATAAVRSTDDDAAVSRLSAVNAAYLQDPFARYFVKRATKRPPLINVGTFVRSWAMDKLVHDFLRLPGLQKKQILSLGAGSDTRFFRLCSNPELFESLHRYVEVDLPESTARKVMQIQKNHELRSCLAGNVNVREQSSTLSWYRLTTDIRPRRHRIEFSNLSAHTKRPPHIQFRDSSDLASVGRSRLGLWQNDTCHCGMRLRISAASCDGRVTAVDD